MNNNDMVTKINTEIQDLIKKEGLITDNISDGYHTFGELYKHRIHLFIALCTSLDFIMRSAINSKRYVIVKSKLHDDGTCFDGWFIVQIETQIGQISYHLPIEYWNKCKFIRTVDRANKWDGHTSDDVLERLLHI